MHFHTTLSHTFYSHIPHTAHKITAFGKAHNRQVIQKINKKNNTIVWLTIWMNTHYHTLNCWLSYCILDSNKTKLFSSKENQSKCFWICNPIKPIDTNSNHIWAKFTTFIVCALHVFRVQIQWDRFVCRCRSDFAYWDGVQSCEKIGLRTIRLTEFCSFDDW